MAAPDVWAVAREPGVLTEKQLRILEMRERRGMSWNEISLTLDISRSGVRQHHRAATRRLARRLEQETPSEGPVSRSDTLTARSWLAENLLMRAVTCVPRCVPGG